MEPRSRLRLKFVLYLPLILGLTLFLYVATPALFLLCVLPFIIWRWAVGVTYTRLHPSSAGVLPLESALYCVPRLVDGVWRHTNHFKVTILLTVEVQDPALDVDALRRLVQREIIDARTPQGKLVYPELRQYPVPWGGYMVWRMDDSFDIKNHIKLYEGAVPGARDAQFCDRFIEEYRHALLPEDRSPWEAYVIQNIGAGKVVESVALQTSLIVFKFAHNLCDGFSAFNAVIRLADGGPAAVKRVQLPPAPSLCSLILTYACLGPFQTVRAWLLDDEPPQNPVYAAARADARSAYPSTRARRNMYKSTRLPLAHVQQVAKVNKVSVTAVLLARAARGIQNYSKSRIRTQKQDTEHAALICDDTDAGALFGFVSFIPSPTHNGARLLNDMCIVQSPGVPLYIDPLNGVNSPPTERERQLQAFQHEFTRLKSGPRRTAPITRKLGTWFFALLPATWVWKLRLRRGFDAVEHIFSIYPGPKDEFRMLGRAVSGMHYVITPGPFYIPFSMGVLSYNSQFQFWISTENELANQHEIVQLCDAITREIMQ